MPLIIPTPKAELAEAVWEYTTRRLTNLLDPRAVLIDNLDALLSSRLSGSAFDARLSAVRAALIDNLDVLLSSRLSKADFDTKLPDARAALIDNLDVLLSTRALESGGNLSAVLTDINNMQVPMPFPSAEVLDDVAVTNPTDTTERTIAVSIPTGSTIVRAMLAALIIAINRSTNAQDIDVDVKGRLGAGSWTTFFTQTDVMSLAAVDKASIGLVALQDVSSLVTGAGTYGFKLTVTLSSANTVRFLTQYLLHVTYKMS